MVASSDEKSIIWVKVTIKDLVKEVDKEAEIIKAKDEAKKLKIVKIKEQSTHLVEVS